LAPDRASSDYRQETDMKIKCIAIFFGLCLWTAASLQAQTLLWSKMTVGEVRGCPAELPDGGIVVGTMNGRLYAFSKDGTQRWTIDIGNDIFGSPAIGPDGTIYVGVDGLLKAIDFSGSTKWMYPTAGDIRSSPALAADGLVVFGSNDRSIYAVQSNGRLRWAFPTGGEIVSSPAIGADGTVYCGSQDNLLYAIGRDGRRKWTYFTGADVDSSPAIGPGGTVLVGSDDQYLYAVNTNGSRRWAYRVPGGNSVSASPAVAPDGTVYVGSNDGKLYALSMNGQLKWTFATTNQSPLTSPAVAADGTIYTISEDGRVYAVTTNGTQLWLYSATNSTTKGHAFNLMSDGTIVMGMDDGRIVALKGTNGPAVSSWPMFRRDPGHNASSFAMRLLAPSYSPGLMQVVTIVATPPTNATGYVVEDQPPAGWTVGFILYNGQFDATNKRVKFGPFTDAEPRTLQYELTPPVRDSGTKFYGGTVGVGSWSGTPVGDYAQVLVPLHPADIRTADGRVALQELTAFILAWKLGTAWSAGPTPIPSLYVDKAVSLWRQGETYRYDSNVLSAPSWWINATNGITPTSLTTNPVVQTATLTSLGTAVAGMPNGYQPEIPFLVTIDVFPATNVLVYALEETPPAGWIASQISDGGVWDSWNKKVKWGPFYDVARRQLTYQINPATNAADQAKFVGWISFNGTNAPIIGQRDVFKGPATTPWVQRLLPDAYAAQWSQTIVLTVNPPPGVAYYVVEDMPPAGWSVTQISADGTYDPNLNVVRFGPFLDDTPRQLTYDVVPPIGENGVQFFVGRVLADGFEFATGGSVQITDVPLHPADQTPVNSIVSLNEVIAYGSAFKSGSIWVQGPNPIPSSYVNAAIDLWKQGEGYRYSTNPPPGAATPWVPDPARIQPGIASLNTNVTLATNCTVQTTMPSNYVAGQLMVVQLQVIPATNVLVYGVEDVPPTDWMVQAVSNDGWFDPVTRKVKWGPFFDRNNRLLTYEIVPAMNSTNPVTFTGLACFDRKGLVIDGRRQLAPILPALLEVVGYGWDTGFTLKLSGAPLQSYEVQKSSDLLGWIQWTMVTNPPNTVLLQDTSATNVEKAFYRALSR
jgi:outer membrane protein assembly factor BamB